MIYTLLFGSVGWYVTSFEYFLEQEAGGGYVDNFRIEHSGQGSDIFNFFIWNVLFWHVFWHMLIPILLENWIFNL